MTRERWIFEKSEELKSQIAALDPVLAHQVEQDIKKVETRGIDNVGEPLVSHLDGDVWYVRSMVKGCGWFRTFYFRDGRISLFGFYGYFKKSKRLPNRVRKLVLQKSEQHIEWRRT